MLTIFSPNKVIFFLLQSLKFKQRTPISILTALMMNIVLCLTNNRDVNTETYFVEWSGDCSGAEPCTLLMDRTRKVTAIFSIDSDGDGKITKEEFIKHKEDMFTKFDKNADGVLDADEQKKSRYES